MLDYEQEPVLDTEWMELMLVIVSTAACAELCWTCGLEPVLNCAGHFVDSACAALCWTLCGREPMLDCMDRKLCWTRSGWSLYWTVWTVLYIAWTRASTAYCVDRRLCWTLCELESALHCA